MCLIIIRLCHILVFGSETFKCFLYFKEKCYQMLILMSDYLKVLKNHNIIKYGIVTMIRNKLGDIYKYSVAKHHLPSFWWQIFITKEETEWIISTSDIVAEELWILFKHRLKLSFLHALSFNRNSLRFPKEVTNTLEHKCVHYQCRINWIFDISLNCRLHIQIYSIMLWDQT